MAEDLDEILVALEVVESSCNVPSRSRTRNLAPYIEEITEYGFNSGLRASEQRRIIKLVATKTELDQTSCTTLIRNLVPAEKVPSDVILTAIGALGQGSQKPSPASQAGIVRWVTAVHEVLEDPSFLIRLYGVLFNLLDMISLRAPICQLLGIITRRKHVRPFRIAKLMQLCNQSGGEYALVNLFRVYKNFCPDIIVPPAQGGRGASSPFDSEWRKRMLLLQEANSQMAMGGNTTANTFKVARNGNGKVKSRAIPEVQSFFATEESVTLEEINSVKDFVEYLDQIELPSQLVAGLRDPLLRKYLMLRPSTDSRRRLDFWLQRYFEEEIELANEGFTLSTSLGEILSGLVSYTETIKELHPTVESFFATYLPKWDGNAYVGPVLELLTYLPPRKFSDIYSTMLSPLEQSILGGATSPFEALFDFYGKLVQRWIEAISTHSRQSPQLVQALCHHLEELLSHISVLMLSALATSESASSSIVTYLEKVSTSTLEIVLSNQAIKLPLNLPEHLTFYNLLLSSSLSSISRLCGVLKQYYAVTTQIRKNNSQTLPPSFIPTANHYIIDSTNLFYRSRAFKKEDKNGVGCLCPDSTIDALQLYLPTVNRDYSLPSMFMFSHNPLMSALAATGFDGLEQSRLTESTKVMHQGPVTLRSLFLLQNEGGADVSWVDYRRHILQWMGAHGLGGLEEFMFAVMSSLSK
ncbi:Mis6-domain-containing protein [Microthyrium microscopicum]|uniref:Mis6-domain-containing protein n=1 Tax=Microthyrium microscopicum TaxID=703497 RepID=A0A6A6UM34_9PEZI|nr:Mis6-domain-containing protein [Microthyrium microscopicum]